MSFEQEPGQQGPQRSTRRGTILRRVLLFVSIALILVGGWQLIRYGLDLLSSQLTKRELKEAALEEIYPTQEPLSTEASEKPEETAAPIQTVATEAPSEDPAFISGTLPTVEYPNGFELNAEIRALRKKSEYIIGWLTMDELEEPVAYKDNSFFLDHDAMGKRNGNGSIFLDQETHLLTRPYTLLLYGHNMKSGAMFGRLRKYKEFSYFYRHRKIQFNTLYEEGSYIVFAAEMIHLLPGNQNYLNLADLQSTDRNRRSQALQALIDHSLHDLMTDVNVEDQLLLLITCDGDDDDRFVVAARRLREGETLP